mmetsp:Transcript_4769/g.11642  ORF Transcript_4769/g.11642 Transcript_4769/m.11642 type:complete len:217 (-) Transcript_4769:174-824(-)
MAFSALFAPAPIAAINALVVVSAAVSSPVIVAERPWRTASGSASEVSAARAAAGGGAGTRRAASRGDAPRPISSSREHSAMASEAPPTPLAAVPCESVEGSTQPVSSAALRARSSASALASAIACLVCSRCCAAFCCTAARSVWSNSSSSSAHSSATSSAVWFCPLSSAGSAPTPRRKSASSASPSRAAMCSGVLPSAALALTLAPRSTRSTAMSR